MDGCGLKKICFIYRYYHTYLHKFRFIKFMIAHTTPSFNKRFLHETICAALCVGIRHSAMRLAASCLRCICGWQ